MQANKVVANVHDTYKHCFTSSTCICVHRWDEQNGTQYTEVWKSNGVNRFDCNKMKVSGYFENRNR